MKVIRVVLSFCAVVMVVGAVGCGDTDEQSASVSGQPSSGPAEATTTDAVPTTATPTTPTTTPTATTGEPGGAGAGDEEPVRTPAAFVVGPDGIHPTKITAAAFLSIDVSLTSKSGPHTVTIDAPGGSTVAIAAGGTRHVVLEGLKPGDYAITTQTGARATLHVVSGGAPGP